MFEHRTVSILAVKLLPYPDDIFFLPSKLAAINGSDAEKEARHRGAYVTSKNSVLLIPSEKYVTIFPSDLFFCIEHA